MSEKSKYIKNTTPNEIIYMKYLNENHGENKKGR